MSAILDLSTCPILTLDDVRILTRIASPADRGWKAGWLVSFGESSNAHNCQPLFTRQAVDRFIARLAAGEFPPSIPNNTPDVQTAQKKRGSVKP